MEGGLAAAKANSSTSSAARDNARSNNIASLFFFRWRCISYKLQAIAPKRPLDFVVRAAKATVVGFQGNQMPLKCCQKSCPPRWEPTWRQRVDDYEVLHWCRPAGAPNSDPRGVGLAWKRKLVPRRCAQCRPAPAGLEGRVGFVRLKRQGICAWAVL